MRNLATTLATLAVAGTALAPVLAAQQVSVYDAVQAERGRRVFGTHCASCHGNDLDGGVGPALAGAAFLHKWSEKGAASLFSVTRTSMPRPATTAGNLVFTGEQSGDFVAFDAADGTELYRFYTGGGMFGGGVSYAVGGRQYVAITSGGGSMTFGGSGSPTVFVFALPTAN